MHAMTTTRPPTRRKLAKAATRAKVLVAARLEFIEKGYEAATIRNIAARAGMTIGAVFSNFASKAHLLAEIIEDDDEQFLDRLPLNMLSRMKLEDAYVSLFERCYQRHVAQLPMLRTRLMLQCAGETPIDQALARERDRMVRIIRGLLQGAIEREGLTQPLYFEDDLLAVHADNLTALATGRLTLADLRENRLTWQVTTRLIPYRPR